MGTSQLLNVIIIISTITCTLSIPLPDSGQHSYQDDTSTNEEHPPLTPKQHLFMFAIEGFNNLTSFYINRAANISTNLLKDNTLNTATDNIVLQEFKKNLTDFLNKYHKIEEFEDSLLLVELYSNFTSDYYEMPKDEMNTETTIIVNLLRKYGSEELDKDFIKKHNEFVKEFCKEFEKVEIFLEKKMLDWFEEFKKITDMNLKTEAFGKFVMLYLE